MGKYSNELKKVKSFATFNDHISKKGKIKGKNKKEKKILKGMCPHFRVTKNGKLKNMVINNGQKQCVCKLCGEVFPARFYEDEELDKIISEFKKTLNENKYIAVQVNGGAKTTEYLMQLGGMVSQYPKISKRLRDVAQKKGKVKHNKDKKNGYKSNIYGDWDTRN